MRIRISHETTFHYAPAARSAILNLRLTPSSFDTQYVLRWRVGVDIDGALRHAEDSLGNVVHAFSYPRPVERMVVSAAGEVETGDAVGVVRGAVEPLQPQMFLRASASAQANGALREFAQESVGANADPLTRLHRLMDSLHETMAFEAGAASARARHRRGPPECAITSWPSRIGMRSVLWPLGSPRPRSTSRRPTGRCASSTRPGIASSPPVRW